MTNPPKKRGTAAETALVRWLLDHGWAHARRNPPAGNRDIGDIGGITTHGTPVVVEVKAYKDLARGINEGLTELEAEKANAGTDRGVLVVKRRGKGDPGEWIAVRMVRDDPELGGS